MFISKPHNTFIEYHISSIMKTMAEWVHVENIDLHAGIMLKGTFTSNTICNKKT